LVAKITIMHDCQKGVFRKNPAITEIPEALIWKGFQGVISLYCN